ncbi:ABC transporter permease [Rhizobium ruizarguesonis]|uniref:ABC transporter permease n=1 Tax=Rhizobium ruizarguesonis TaxID=2081791 RepID=A0ABY1XFT2_9HYPH|nr:ABC transporter permease [Rhizobium ruizarguesonis]NKL41528.1 ABC transporter permease subunit [Rhizobium leguminosarum bv. viciae]QND22248.1 ABC transporter permease [Rhizobium leguminosarum bv. viciae]TAU28637.1 ABC transporter permease [Rhizobium ruizarguesonis]TAU70635.1 ABC transporter permease [Rhizobium ruizarguesonis]TAU78375.1 ABC transporter permease [Rhizobium ruizarguesonis]
MSRLQPTQTDLVPGEAVALAETLNAAMPKTARFRMPSGHPMEWFAFVFLAVLIISSVFVEFIPGLVRASFPYGDFSQGPEWSLNGLFGTDALGRSILSRVLYGARTTLAIVSIATLISLVIGMTLGMLAGFYRGPVERIVDLYANSMASLPPILVILALISVIGNSVFTMMLALGLLDIGTYARIAKGGVIAQNDRDYVLAARAMGASDMRLLLREILPNLVPALTAIVPPLMAGLIITEGSLSFLGYGIPAPAPSWGGMIASSTDLLSRFPVLIFGPIVAIVLTVYSLNTVGDCLARRMNHRGREL